MSHPYVRAMDRITGGIGRFIAWLTLAMVLIGAYNAIVRYLGRFVGWGLSSNTYLELQWYLFSLVFLLGAGYGLKEDAHVRIDIVYARLSRRGKAWIDTLGTLFFLLPFSLFCLYVSWPSVRNSWAVREMSPDPGGLPRYPLKAVILVCFVLLIAQAIAELIRNVSVLRSGDGTGESEETTAEPSRWVPPDMDAPPQDAIHVERPEGVDPGEGPTP